MFREFVKGYIIPYKNRIKTELDFGCGPTPVLADILKKHGFEVDIYDIFFAPVKSYINKQYDLITSTEVIEHLSDPLKILHLLKNRLNNNGRRFSLRTRAHRAALLSYHWRIIGYVVFLWFRHSWFIFLVCFSGLQLAMWKFGRCFMVCRGI